MESLLPVLSRCAGVPSTRWHLAFPVLTAAVAGALPSAAAMLVRGNVLRGCVVDWTLTRCGGVGRVGADDGGMIHAACGPACVVYILSVIPITFLLARFLVRAHASFSFHNTNMRLVQVRQWAVVFKCACDHVVREECFTLSACMCGCVVVCTGVGLTGICCKRSWRPCAAHVG